MVRCVANDEAREYVKQKQPFTNRNKTLFAEWKISQAEGMTFSRYVVYSYGEHWPLFIYDQTSDRWFANGGKCSVTTSKHFGYAHPHTMMTVLSLDEIKWLARDGMHGMIARRMAA